MVTTSQAIERVRDGLSLPDATVRYAARYLADAGLWPKGGRGGGKNAAHIELDHLVNLILALTVSDELRSAPALVADFRALVRLGSTLVEERDVPVAPGGVEDGAIQARTVWRAWMAAEADTQGLPGATAAECLWNMISIASHNGALFDEIFGAVSVDRTNMVVRVECPFNGDGADRTSTHIYGTAEGKGASGDASPLLAVQTRIPPQAFHVLGAIARDAREESEGELPLDAGSDDEGRQEETRPVGADRASENRDGRLTRRSSVPKQTEHSARGGEDQDDSDSRSESVIRSNVATPPKPRMTSYDGRTRDFPYAAAG